MRNESQKLKNYLERIQKKKIRDATQRIAGKGDKVKGAIKKIFSFCKGYLQQLFKSGEKLLFHATAKTSLRVPQQRNKGNIYCGEQHIKMKIKYYYIKILFKNYNKNIIKKL